MSCPSAVLFLSILISVFVSSDKTEHRRRYDFESYLSKSYDVFLCVVRRPNGPYNFWLTCDRVLTCKLSSNMRDFPQLEVIAEMPHLDAFTDNCTEVYNNFQRGENVSETRFPLLNGRYVISQTEITQLEFVNIHITRMPPDYFCKLTSLTRLTFKYKAVLDSRHFNFAKECSSHCCACNLRHLNLPSNHMRVVGNASFCGFPKLETLNLSSNEITTVEENAFAMLSELRKLDVSQNRLRILPSGVFRPLTSLVSLDLNGNQLTDEIFQALQHVPKLLALVELNLQSNQLTSLSATFHDFKQLRVLNLQSNLITDIGNETGLSSLIELNLRRNQLTRLRAVFHDFEKLQLLDVERNNISSISSTVFDPMGELTKINLDYNLLRSLPDNLLSKNGRIQTLSLATNRLTSIPKLNSTSLDTLLLGANLVENLTLVDTENLCQLVNLTFLVLADNRIRSIAPHAFDCRATKLSNLVLRNNSIESILRVFDESRVQVLDLGSNNLTSFSFSDFANDLLELDLSDNHIADIHFDSFDRAMGLKQLLLSRNDLRNLTDVTLPANLDHLDLSYNQIVFFSFARDEIYDGYRKPPFLDVLDLRFNMMDTACPLVLARHDADIMSLLMGQNPLLCACEVNFFKKEESFFWAMDSDEPPGTCPAALESFSDNVTIVNADGLLRKRLFACGQSKRCQCNTRSSYFATCSLPCPESCACYIDHSFTAYFVNCSGRELLHVPDPSIQPRLSLVLDLSSNHLELLDGLSFSPFLRVVELYLQSNKLANITPDAFRNLPKLEVLNLEDNCLEELPANLFDGSPKLTELYLAQNRLMHLPADIFQPLMALRMLRMQSNLLTKFPVWKFEEFPVLSHLRLSNNPWSCECGYVERFRDWLQNTTHLVDDVGDLSCTSEGETDVRHPLLSFNSSYCYPSFPVYVVGSGTHIWTSAVAVVVLFIVVSILVFVYRREMQVLIYSRYGMRLFHPKQDADEGKVYDAFIAYSGYDVEFVVHNLVPRLEQIERPYKLCIHERDFLVGAIITDSILEAIELSRRTIVVLSQNFVTSGWCRFEFKSAHLQMLSDRCSRIIVILLDDVPRDVDPEIKLYLKTNTYLKWGDKLFWQKLYYALPDRKADATDLKA